MQIWNIRGGYFLSGIVNTRRKECYYMNETNTNVNVNANANVNKNFEKILSLSKEELEKIFSQLSMTEIEDLLNKLNEVDENE